MLELRHYEGLLQRLLRHAAEGRWFLAMCLALAAAGTMTATFPVTAVVLPAALLLPRRWRGITLASASGSALGGTLLVMVFHHLGWQQVYAYFPHMADNAAWNEVTRWAATWGVAALFVIAATPLPQTPALVFFGMARHDYAGVLVALLAGKLLKYGLLAWLAARFPQRFSNGLGGLWRRRK